MSLDAKERLRKSAVARSRPQISFASGQWVYVWRRQLKGVKGKLHTRWVGPGVVLMAEGTSVYVLVGKRLWKASREQERPATREESVGAELVLADGRFKHLLSRAQLFPQGLAHLDVTGEGPPDEDETVSDVESENPAEPNGQEEELPQHDSASEARSVSGDTSDHEVISEAEEQPADDRSRSEDEGTEALEPEQKRLKMGEGAEAVGGGGGGSASLRHVSGDVPVAMARVASRVEEI